MITGSALGENSGRKWNRGIICASVAIVDEHGLHETGQCQDALERLMLVGDVSLTRAKLRVSGPAE